MARIVSLADAVAELVTDGATVALEGFTHLVPFAAGQEIIRQRRRRLTVVRMTPDIIVDQMIGAGCVERIVFSWGGNPGVGSLHRLRDAVESGWPSPLGIEEHSHFELANRYVAGATGLPFTVIGGARGTSLDGRTASTAPITCPFTNQVLTAVRAMNPEVGVVHAQQADREGNVQLWGITGVQKEIVLASSRSLVTVEEIVDRLELRPGGVILPSWVITLVSPAPGGARPSYADGYYERDNDVYRAWDAISRDRNRFQAWLAAELGVGA